MMLSVLGIIATPRLLTPKISAHWRMWGRISCQIHSFTKSRTLRIKGTQPPKYSFHQELDSNEGFLEKISRLLRRGWKSHLSPYPKSLKIILLSAPPPCVSQADSQPAPHCIRTQARTVSSLYSQIPSTFNHLPPNSQEPLHPGTFSEEGGRHGEEGSAPSQLMSV